MTSTPEGAQVLLDGRPRGVTPWQGPSLPGPREFVVTKDGFAPFPARVNVTAAQRTTVPVELSALVVTPPPSAPPPIAPLPIVPAALPSPLPDHAGRAPRPRWRLVSGGLALGAGVLLAGFGGSALAWNGHCADAAPPAAGPCATTFQTTGVGGGFLATGLVLAVGGAVLLALPGPQP